MSASAGSPHALVVTIRLQGGDGLGTPFPNAATGPILAANGRIRRGPTRSTPTNARLGLVLSPGRAVTRLLQGDIALGRLDVQTSLDGIEGGWWALDALESAA